LFLSESLSPVLFIIHFLSFFSPVSSTFYKTKILYIPTTSNVNATLVISQHFHGQHFCIHSSSQATLCVAHRPPPPPLESSLWAYANTVNLPQIAVLMEFENLIALLFWIFTPPVLSVYRLDLPQRPNLLLPKNCICPYYCNNVWACCQQINNTAVFDLILRHSCIRFPPSDCYYISTNVVKCGVAFFPGPPRVHSVRYVLARKKSSISTFQMLLLREPLHPICTVSQSVLSV